MKEEKLIKIVRRIGMPETNSSSSHAVSISMDPEGLVAPGDKDWDINIEDGILKIPGGVNFGWEYFKTNSILTKLQYLCGIYCYDIRTDSGKKSIVRLKKILKEIFGVRDVEFLWITKFSKKLKEEEDPEDVYYDYPEIDHNSHDIFEEITENINVIRAFLLSRNSWLYGGNDNSSAPEGFYNKPISTNRVNAILSIELGGDYGRVDWEIKNLFDKVGLDVIRYTLSSDDEFNILEGIYYNTETKTWEDDNNVDLKDLTNGKILTYFTYSLYCKDQQFYILYTNHDFNGKWMNIKKEVGKDEVMEKIMLEVKEGIDYIKIPIKIKLLEYGNYEI